MDARPRPRRHDRRDRQRDRHTGGARGRGAGHDRLAHRHRAHGGPLRRQPRCARRPRGDRSARGCGRHDTPTPRSGVLHERGRLALPARHDGIAHLCRGLGARGGARRRRHRRCDSRRRARADRLRGLAPVPRPRTRRVRRAAHRARPGARSAGSDDRRRRGRAGHLLAGAHDPRSVQPRGHHADGDASRRRLRGGRDRRVPAAARRTRSAGRRSPPSVASISTPTSSTSFPERR